MSYKNMKARFSQKHDIEANWEKASNFYPLEGEIIIYDPDDRYPFPRFKVGLWNGIEADKKDWMQVSALPFASHLKNVEYNVETQVLTVDGDLVVNGDIEGNNFDVDNITTKSLISEDVDTNTLKAQSIQTDAIEGTSATFSQADISSSSIQTLEVESATITNGNIADFTAAEASIGSLEANSASLGQTSATSISTNNITLSGDNELEIDANQILLKSDEAQTVLTSDEIATSKVIVGNSVIEPSKIVLGNSVIEAGNIQATQITIGDTVLNETDLKEILEFIRLMTIGSAK